VSRRLERSRTDRVIAGVCGGIAEYFEVDATLVRVGMVILGLGGLGILIYIVLLIVMPLPGEPAPFFGDWVGFERQAPGTATPGDPSAPTASAARAVADPASVERRRYGLGLLLVAIGGVFFLGNLGLFRALDWKFIWPFVIIAFGVYLLAERTRR